MMNIKLILRYPNGERKIKTVILDGSIAHEYTGIYPIGWKGKNTYLVYQSDIGYQNSFLGNYLPINDFIRVVDIDVNELESMTKQKNKDPEHKGISIKSRCTDLFDSKKQEFLKGYLVRKIQIKKQTIDLTSFVAGLGIGGFAIMLIQEILKATQGIS